MDSPQLVILVDTDKLIPYENNARLHDAAQIEKIRASIAEFGFVNPILIDASNGVIAGHGRLEAARLAGIKQVPCLRVTHLTEERKRAYILADNRIAELAKWDMELVKSELLEIADMGINMELTGFDLDAIKPDALDLDDDSVGESDKNVKLCHCPKCGFEFEG